MIHGIWGGLWSPIGEGLESPIGAGFRTLLKGFAILLGRDWGPLFGLVSSPYRMGLHSIFPIYGFRTPCRGYETPCKGVVNPFYRDRIPGVSNTSAIKGLRTLYIVSGYPGTKNLLQKERPIKTLSIGSGVPQIFYSI